MAEKQRVLDLDDLTERSKFITFGGQDYDLANPRALGIIEFHKLQKGAQRCEALMGREGDLADEEVGELSALLRGLVGMILIAPPEVMEKLTDTQRLSIVAAFNGTLPNQTPPAGASVGAASTSTGESRSRDSSASTAARRRTGSRRRRQSSAPI